MKTPTTRSHESKESSNGRLEARSLVADRPHCRAAAAAACCCYCCWACLLLLLLLRIYRCCPVTSAVCSVLETSVYFACATARLVRSRTSTRSYQGMEPSNGRTIGGSHRPGNALGRSGPGFHRGCGVNPAVSRCAGPSSAWNERKRLGEPVLLFLRDTRTCTRNVRTVFTFK